jgi:RimJ/RimL family protein N-acetyltransferase
MTIPTLETPNLLLRPWQPADAEDLYAIVQEPGIFQYFPRPSAPPRPWVDKYIQHHLDHWQARGMGHWAVVTRQEQRLVGWTGLEYLPELDQVEVAYLLSTSVHGRGYATQAARAACAYGFETCRLPLIIGLVHPQNAASIRVLEKCDLAYTDRLTLWGLELLRYSAPPPETAGEKAG